MRGGPPLGGDFKDAQCMDVEKYFIRYDISYLKDIKQNRIKLIYLLKRQSRDTVIVGESSVFPIWQDLLMDLIKSDMSDSTVWLSS